MSNWKDTMSTDEKLQADPKWYYIPPYKNEGHKIVDSAGQELATFEMKEHAVMAVESYNEIITYKGNK